ncbi:hypothetical protein CAMRE0001_1050 [Campylobacter rectus RM3267]|uniref:Uncharacterized protein n=1 Tax=Campylobacter rectus RM3267 TaxID=553218 RepID=B9D2V0_CAMRE|nr:hypothetical protein CAMRE0001_1050 [Campylobacter rectus RM3267]
MFFNFHINFTAARSFARRIWRATRAQNAAVREDWVFLY